MLCCEPIQRNIKTINRVYKYNTILYRVLLQYGKVLFNGSLYNKSLLCFIKFEAATITLVKGVEIIIIIILNVGDWGLLSQITDTTVVLDHHHHHHLLLLLLPP